MRLNYYAVLSLCLGLTACNAAQDSANNAMDTIGNETSSSLNKIREMTGMQTKKPPKPANIQPRYCYRTFEDIVCYGKPVPGDEERLVAYQNQRGGAGYTLEPAALPQEALPPLKSVNVPSPPQVKGDANSPLKEIIFDPSELDPKQLVPEKEE